MDHAGRRFRAGGEGMYSVQLAHCHAKGCALGGQREQNRRDSPSRRSYLLVRPQAHRAFDERQDPTAEKEQHSDDKRPEVGCPALTQRMLGGWRRARLTATQKQQSLVAGIGDRMKGLRQQRARSGEHRAGELGDRDRDIGGE